MVLCLSWGAGLRADEVFFTDNPASAGYDDIVNTLRDVYGSGSATAGVRASPSGRWEETNYGLYQINGTGNQTIRMTFLYDDGAYQFEFGYFRVTETLLALPSNTVAEKQAWAIEALSTANAQVVFVDRTRGSAPPGAVVVTTDTNDVYTSASNDALRNHDTGSGNTYASINNADVTLVGGAYYGFFIIPNNTLAAFQSDAASGTFESFALNGGGANAWPLFTLNQGNPGNSSNGSGTGLDQVFTFFGTTRNTTADALSATSNPNFAPDPNSPGAVLTFEDIWRGPGSGSDNDFNDLHFYVDNTLVSPVIPEPGTWAAGVGLAAFIAWNALGRRGRRGRRTRAPLRS